MLVHVACEEGYLRQKRRRRFLQQRSQRASAVSSRELHRLPACNKAACGGVCQRHCGMCSALLMKMNRAAAY